MEIGKNFSYNVPNRNIKFLCEQDGVPEQELKKRLSDLFIREKAVLRAYLVRMDFELSEEYLVALCLYVITKNHLKLVKKISEIFSKMFSSDQHIEIIFLDDETETKVVDVCKPFYIRNIK